MGRHHEPDRAAMRHRSRPVALPRRAAARRQLQDHRHQDFHFRRRARSDRQHHPSGAGAHRRCAGRHQGHFAVHCAEILAHRRWRAGRTQRGVVRLDRREDGHPRQRHLRHELRRRHRLAHRREASRSLRHVHDDEHGAAQRRRAGTCAVRSRLSERRRLRQGAALRARAGRREISATSRPIPSSCIRTCAAC